MHYFTWFNQVRRKPFTSHLVYEHYRARVCLVTSDLNGARQKPFIDPDQSSKSSVTFSLYLTGIVTPVTASDGEESCRVWCHRRYYKRLGARCAPSDVPQVGGRGCVDRCADVTHWKASRWLFIDSVTWRNILVHGYYPIFITSLDLITWKNVLDSS